MAYDGHRREPAPPAAFRPGPPPQTAPTSAAPADPWPESTYLPPGAIADLGPPRRSPVRWLIPVAAVTVVLALVTFVAVAFWPGSDGDDPTAPLAFTPLAAVAEVEFAADASPSLTDMTADRGYAAATVGDDLELVALDLATGDQLWRQLLEAPSEGTGWAFLAATDDVVAVIADRSSSTEPRPMIVLDPETGEEWWRVTTYGSDVIYPRPGALAVAGDERIVGYEPRTGVERWAIDYPEGATPAIAAVFAPEDLSGPSRHDGTPAFRTDPRLVLVGGDRSAQMVDAGTGEVLWQRGNVAEPRDLLTVHADRLLVADSDGGYRVLAYDLTADNGEPRTVYTAPDGDRRLTGPLQPCGEARVCGLDRLRGDSDTTELVAVDLADGGQLWRHPVAGGEQMAAAGEVVTVGTNEPSVVAFDADGGELFSRAGRAVRVNAGNLLVFGDTPRTFARDINVVGYQVRASEFVGLDQARQAVAGECTWRGDRLLCPTDTGAVLWRTAAE